MTMRAKDQFYFDPVSCMESQPFKKSLSSMCFNRFKGRNGKNLFARKCRLYFNLSNNHYFFETWIIFKVFAQSKHFNINRQVSTK